MSDTPRHNTPQKPYIQLRQLYKKLGPGFDLLIEDLHIASGQVFCLLGPTGAGKSTLLRLLAGLELPDRGTVELGPYRLQGDGWPLPVQRKLCLVFQRPMLLSGSVRHNVEYPLRLRSRVSASTQAAHWLRRLGLEKLERQSARTLSGGQMQLVALARALAIEPELLLLDEPTANLDPAHVALVEGVISDHHRARQTTIIWATHNLFQARRVAGRVGLLLAGRLIEVADSKTFFESPSDPRTADFIHGKMIY